MPKEFPNQIPEQNQQIFTEEETSEAENILNSPEYQKLLIEDNGKAQLYDLGENARATESGTLVNKLLVSPSLSKPVILCASSSGGFKEGDFAEVGININNLIDALLVNYKKQIAEYYKFKKFLETKGVKKFDYITAAYEYGVEGDEGMWDTYISPRFIRCQVRESTRIEVSHVGISMCSLPKRLGERLMLSFYKWLVMNNACFTNGDIGEMVSRQIREKVQYEQINEMVIDGIKNGFGYSDMSIRGRLRDSGEGVSFEEYREQIFKAMKDYSSFLEEAYAEAEHFVSEIEKYKTEDKK